jgi:hypothetical protein
MRFMMLIAGEEAAWTAGDDRTRAVMGEISAWYDRQLAAGTVLPGGAQLDLAGSARTVGVGADGRPQVTDGPYVELKEVIGGIVVLDAADLDEAVAVAATWPGLVPFRERIEVRPVLERAEP